MSLKHSVAPVDPVGDQLAQALHAVANLNDVMQQIHTGMKSRNASRLLGADPRPFVTSFTPAGNPGLISANSSGLIVGLNLRETAGVATVVRVLDGTDSSAPLIWSAALTASASLSANFPNPISYTSGVFVQILSGGAVEGVIYQIGGGAR